MSYLYLLAIVDAVIVSKLVTTVIAMRRGNDLSTRQLLDLRAFPDALITSVVALFVASLIVEKTTHIGSAILFVLLWFIVEARIKDVSKKAKAATHKELSYAGLTGVFVGLLVSLNEWQDSASWLVGSPGGEQSNLFGYIALGVLIVSELASLVIRKSKIKSLPTSRRLIRSMRLSLTLPSVILLGVVSAQKQFDIAFIDSRIWFYFAGLAVALISIWSYLNVYKSARKHLREEATHFKKQKKIARKQSKKKSKRKK